MPQRSRKIAGVISEVMIESSTKHDLLYSPSIADAPKASLKDHTGRGAAGLCEDRPRPNRRKKTLRTKLFAAFGAGDEARTRYLHLGKVALYRMSYTRIPGASGRNRTNDTGIFSPLLYLLSYRGMLSRALALLRMLKNGDPERTRTVDLQRDRLAC